jgi:hypothetical protein
MPGPRRPGAGTGVLLQRLAEQLSVALKPLANQPPVAEAPRKRRQTGRAGSGCRETAKDPDGLADSYRYGSVPLLSLHQRQTKPALCGLCCVWGLEIFAVSAGLFASKLLHRS